uniref:Uncharacterized protein n=1 Tax=Rousettus aegyptiacus TaxID=9407 RepID=A0A7J8C2L3_ROUAE|nr:hypothetical protein HJG63_009421 [Rousettus aegyptiacus]
MIMHHLNSENLPLEAGFSGADPPNWARCLLPTASVPLGALGPASQDQGRGGPPTLCQPTRQSVSVQSLRLGFTFYFTRRKTNKQTNKQNLPSVKNATLQPNLGESESAGGWDGRGPGARSTQVSLRWAVTGWPSKNNFLIFGLFFFFLTQSDT